MAKRDYSKYSNKKNEEINQEDDILTPEVEVEVDAPEVKMEPEVETVEEPVEAVPAPKTVKGVIANCSRLNVRVAPNAGATVACVLDAKAVVEIDMTKSTDEWFSICTAAGTEGYCMRKFVNARL